MRVLRFRDAMVHAKTATVDGTWCTVGTANIDRLSLQGNYEINLEAIDQELAKQLEEIFLVDQSNCLELTSGSGRRATCTASSPRRSSPRAAAAVSRERLARRGIVVLVALAGRRRSR